MREDYRRRNEDNYLFQEREDKQKRRDERKRDEKRKTKEESR